MYRSLMLLLLSLSVAGCELAASVFQAGFVVGIAIVLVIVGLLAWLIGRFRR